MTITKLNWLVSLEYETIRNDTFCITISLDYEKYFCIIFLLDCKCGELQELIGQGLVTRMNLMLRLMRRAGLKDLKFGEDLVFKKRQNSNFS